MSRSRETDRRRADPGTQALVVAIARALDCDRAALLLADVPGGPLVVAAAYGPIGFASIARGAPPPEGPWSAVLSLSDARPAPGLLLLARSAGAPLSPDEGTLLDDLAGGLRRAIEHPRLEAEIAQSRVLMARADRLSALGTLAASIAHEIRNPLVSVRTFIQLFPERLHDEEFRVGFREIALSEVERITEMVNDVLAFSRPTHAELELANLNEVTSRTARLLEAEARKRGVALRCHFDGALPAVAVDDMRVKQVLTNVVLNAIEACGPRGRVEVSTYSEVEANGHWCVVEVADSGSGISAEEVRHIFDPFFTTKTEGSGLGLYIASRIMNDHGGQIRVTTHEDGGAVFRLCFPVPAEGEDGTRG